MISYILPTYFGYVSFSLSLRILFRNKKFLQKKTLLTKQLEDCLKKSGYALVNVIYSHKQKYKFCRECVNVVLQCIM